MFQKLEDFVNLFDFSFRSISDFGITDVIDILLVAYIIYFFLGWIRETRAWSLFKGIMILVILNKVFFALKLYTLAWLLQSLFAVGLVALIILFQPELRKVLEEIGRGRFIIHKEEEFGEFNKEIVKALKSMSSTRTGALICIERDVPLGEFEKTGINIDAAITSQLILNIFEDKTPLHDGAVIVKHGRIAAAGCILPVTAQEIGKELGTRHRAAVGISEVSDAIVLVASEETGAISMARNGKLFKNLKTEEIFDILQKNMDGNETKQSKFFNFRGFKK